MLPSRTKLYFFSLGMSFFPSTAYIKTRYTKSRYTWESVFEIDSKQPEVTKVTGGFKANIQGSSDINSLVLRRAKGYKPVLFLLFEKHSV